MTPVDQALDLGGLRQPGQVIKPAALDCLDREAHAQRFLQAVGEFALDVAAYQLRRDGRPVKLGRQPMRCRPGQPAAAIP